MKKVLTAFIVVTFTMIFEVAPCYAILEKFNKTPEFDVLSAVNIDWWRNLSDPYLEDYISRAISNNNDIKSMALRLEQAQLNVLSARVSQLPSVVIGATPSTAKMPGTTKAENSIALPIIAQYELDLFGKNWDKTKSAKKLLKSTEYDITSADISIVSYVGATYYNIVRLDKMIELQEKIAKDRQNIYDIAQEAYNQGTMSSLDLTLIEKNYILAQNDLIEYQKQRQNALNALAVLVGDSADNTAEYKRISYNALSSQFSIPDTISSDIIINRPDYKSLEYQLESAGLDTRAAKKEFLPSINIIGLLTFLASTSMHSMNWDNAAALLAGSVELPVFTGFARIANLKLNKNKYKLLLENYQKTNLTAIQEVNDSLYNYKQDNIKFLNNQKALKLQKENFGYTLDKYNHGVISKLDLLQQEEGLLTTEKITASSKLDCYIDKISLYKTTGAKI